MTNASEHGRPGDPPRRAKGIDDVQFPEDTFDEADFASPPLLSAELPQLEDSTAQHAILVNRLAQLRIRRSSQLRRMKYLIAALQVVAFIIAIAALSFSLPRIGQPGACCTAVVVGLVCWTIVGSLANRWIERPAWLAVQPWFCPGCGYDLAGHADDRPFPCPECGTACDPEALRHPTLTSADLIDEIRFSMDADLKWLIRQRPAIVHRSPEAIVAALEGIRASAAPSRPRPFVRGLLVFAKGFLGCLLTAIGICWIIVGIVDSAWHGLAGMVLVVPGILLLVFPRSSRRRRMLAILDERLGAEDTGRPEP